jgi:penicillin amidase
VIGKALKLVLVLLLVAVALAFMGVRHLRTGPGIETRTLSAEGLAQPVEILYDSMGVPHIYASSLEDLLFAQGHVHATHRLWQMETSRRAIQGRLSEVFGPTTLESDRFLRTIGLGKAAEEGMPPRDTPIYRLMERYSQGVNSAIEGWEDLLPPEFVLLRFRPEPWSPVLVQGMEKIMAWDLADYSKGLSLAAAREELGDSAFAPLWPSYPDWGVTIVEGWPENLEDRPWAGPPTDSPQPTTPPQPPPLPPAPNPNLIAQATVPAHAARLLDMASAVRASNSWVVGGQKSLSGKPLLANDMHLALNAPNIWFLVGLHAPGYEVVGMSLPGAPGVVAGHSRAMAWGFTNAMVDDSDFFIEQVNPDDSTQYLTSDGWAAFETREETIQVKGGDPITETVRSTRHGPVITPVERRAGDQVLAFQWVAHQPAGTFAALLDMGRARNAEEFLEAMKAFDNPHQNVVFADTSGAWGYWMGGHVPSRASSTPPHLPVPGWTGEHDWIGWVPFAEKPHVLAPARGYVTTANNAQDRGELARLVTDNGWFDPYRAQRISQLLEATDLHDAESLLAIQMNPGSAFVDRHIGRAVEAFRRAGFESLALRLERWDRLADLESTEATLFHTWWASFHRAFRRHYYGGGGGYFPDRILEKALEGTLATPPELALPPGLAEEAARAAAEFADLPWGEAHQLRLDHFLSGVPYAGSLFRFGRSEIPRVGGPYSVNVAGFGGTRPPFQTGYGPSQRHVVDMADVDGSGGFILPGGQSGYPDNRHSFDQLELWREGRLWLLPLDRSLVQARSVATVTLEPGSS